MACDQTCRKPLWQLQIYQKAINEKYDEIKHWIWILNAISEVQGAAEAAKNYTEYTALKETVKKSKNCEKWKFLKKIEEIESQCAGPQNVLSDFGRKVVEAEKRRNIEEAERVHKILRDVHSSVEDKKKEKFGECRLESEKEYVDYEKCISTLYAGELNVQRELLDLIDRLKICLPSEAPHPCGLCYCCYVSKHEACSQTTPLNLKNRKVVRKCKILSEDFQGSVQGRLKEDFPTLPEGIFCYKYICKKRVSQKKMKQAANIGEVQAKRKATFVPSSPKDESGGKVEQNSSKSYSENSQLKQGHKAVGNVAKVPPEKRERDEERHGEIESIDKVAQSFIEFAKHSGNTMKPLVIIAKYLVEDFLKYVGDVGGCVTKEKGDFDILILSPQLGVLCGEIKATTDDACNLLRRMCAASVQCQKCKSIFQEMFRDKIDMYDIPVHGFIALPFVSRGALHFGSKGESRNRQSKLQDCPLSSNILTEEDMESKQNFISWLENMHGGAVDTSDEWVMTKDQYWTLLERFVGFGSKAQIVSYPKHINDIGDRCFHIPLTDDQRDLVNQKGTEYRFLTLAGDYGTGKSLILVKRAINVAREINGNEDRKGKVIIIACSDICVDGEYLDRKFPEHTVHHLQRLWGSQYDNIISLETFGSFTKAASPDLSGAKGMDLLKNAISGSKDKNSELHLMFDEVPAKFVEKMQSPECQEIFSECLQSVKTLWLVVGSHSYRVWRNSSTDRYVKHCIPSSRFRHVYLNKVLRSPKSVFRVSQEISKQCDDDHQGFLRNDCFGEKPMLFRVPKCSCEGSRGISRHESRESNPLQCVCIEKRLTLTLKAIFQKIGIFVGDRVVEDGGKWPGKVTMLTFGVEDDNLFRDLHSLLIKCCKNISGLHFRDTIMGESRERDGSVKYGQGNQAASEWGCLGDSFESDDVLHKSDSDSQSSQAVAIGGCQGDSFSSEDDRNCCEVCSQHNHPVGECSCGGTAHPEVSNINSKFSLQENQVLDAEGCTLSSLDSENSSGDSVVSLGVVGQNMADVICSGDTFSCEENSASNDCTRQDNQAVSVAGCGNACMSYEEGGDKGKGKSKTEGAQEKLDCKENAKMDVDSGSDRPQILLTRANYFVGCESHVVICIDLNAMKHWFKNTKVAYSTLAVSRCLSQYIHLTWNEEEAEIMFKMNVKALGEDLDSVDKENIEKGSGQSTLENLLKEEVITEQIVAMNM
ncbi:hypothetical protein HOLleu_23828 [Holothuria leucospilota]|uniref:Uncharacterized protein n=1 Tax=Holothuria leucospilota TaxID=206669 RepID=A0A9Q1BVU7_HOLLE|nr:hypothetical protein HOLleu_23828 [Holothuria leucospilota]